MITIPLDLPAPTLSLQAQSAELCQLIRQEISHEPSASISFERFMELALYEPKWGYYTAGLDKFGKAGDFTNAPEISHLFARCIVRQCQQFFWTDETVQEVRVAYEKQRFVYCLQPVAHSLKDQLIQLKLSYFPEVKAYQTELRSQLKAWLGKLSDTLEQGLALIIDYGFPAQEYYHPDRADGTLLCYYQHRTHADPLSLVGLQDITASVDFTDLARAAVQFGLQVAGFTSQAAFLLNNDLLPLIEKCYDEVSTMDVNRRVHLLTSPSEMGELIKVMGLTRNCESFPLNGFKLYDKRMRL